MFQPIIALTMGDPAGVGPELILKIVGHPQLKNRCRILFLGDHRHLYRVQKQLGGANNLQRVSVIPVSTMGRVKDFFVGKTSAVLVDFKNVPSGKHLMGVTNKACGKASGDYICAAISLAMKRRVHAIVTCPINKQSFHGGGWGKKYTGHTEMLAALTGAKTVALMMVTGGLRAVHVTSHIPIKQVAKIVTEKRVFQTLMLTHKGLRLLGFNQPRIAVSALNPHAGDGGLIGNEEERIIKPAVRRAKKKRLNVEGPIPADTMWPRVLAHQFDAGVAMYHDQGQIPVKLLSMVFDRTRAIKTGGVNVTLGLPIIRTSVAHGTAYEIAGRGIASERSLIEAIRLAITMAKNKYERKRDQY